MEEPSGISIMLSPLSLLVSLASKQLTIFYLPRPRFQFRIKAKQHEGRHNPITIYHLGRSLKSKLSVSAAKRVNLKSKELPGPFEFDANESCVGSSGLIRLATLRPTRDNEAFCSFPAEARRICSYSILEALGRQINMLDVGLMKCRDV